jgi:EAL domain-containing protein (putative c-di-GMP-specific phosphodiesterase class I)/GGDEF domain-containing protein
MPNFKAKVVAIAAAAAAPWPVALLTTNNGFGLVLPILACTIASAALLYFLGRLLDPLSKAAASLRAIPPVGATHDPGPGRDDMITVSEGVAHLVERINGLQHRWVWRHSLTGLPTRESLAAAIADDLRSDLSLTLVGAIRFADYDRLTIFDPVAADAALKRFSERLAGSLGRSRPLAHVDRDCFAIWFRDTEAETAVVEFQALCYALGAEIVAGEMKVVPEIEVGTALYPTDATEPAALINHALLSLARPGASGTIDLSPGKAAHVARERFALEQDLHHAISRGQLEMAFQPVVDLSKGALIGAEALLRWRHPQVGMVSPARFIPILEDADLIDEIGRWTLNAACREMRRWQRRGLEGLKVAVNLSANQLRDPDLKQMVERTLARHHLRPQALELELTETAATEDSERTFALFHQLRALGVSLAIDDFGSGYSSLSYLKNLPFDKLKIDREFVTDVHLRKDSQAICRSLIELTRGLGLQILAEGVESWDEVDTLQRFGCRIFQGFFFAEPLNSDQFVNCALDPAWRQRLQTPLSRERQELARRMTA